MVLYKKLVPFVVDDIPPEHKFPGLGPPGPGVKCFKQIYVPGLAVVGNLSNTDKRRWGQRSIAPAHSVLVITNQEFTTQNRPIFNTLQKSGCTSCD